MWVHGGAFQLGDRRELPPTFAPESVFRLLNEAGIACATVDYRHSLEAPFPAQLHDLKAAVRYLREHAGILGIDAAASAPGANRRAATWRPCSG